MSVALNICAAEEARQHIRRRKIVKKLVEKVVEEPEESVVNIDDVPETITEVVEVTTEKKPVIIDQFEDDEKLKVLADAFCRRKAIINPRDKYVLPYHPDCRYYWVCLIYNS